AYDDDTLAARIALNEALYLRREPPAANPPPRRVLLIDVGIRMWGLPRIFATAAAMALAATADPHAELATYRVAGDVADAADLTSRKGLIKHLAVLRPDPHPAAAMQSIETGDVEDTAEPAALTELTL